MEKIQVLVVDDESRMRKLVKDFLIKSNYEVLEASNGEEAVDIFLENKDISLIILDVMMPGMNGAELSKIVHKKFPEIKILALSMSGQGDLVNQMITDADIAGYVLKNIGKKELIEALEKISAGGIYFSDEVLQEMTKASEIKKEGEEAHLTAREIEIIKLIEKEYNNKQIAEALFLSERTVETHRKNIFRKTKTSGVIGLIKFAYEHKLI